MSNFASCKYKHYSRQTCPMFKKFFLLAILFLPVLAMGQRREFVLSPVNAEQVVTEEKLRIGVEFLSDEICEGRASGTPGAFMASWWIRNRFKQAGLVPFDRCWVDGFKSPDGKAGHNIMGMFPGYGDGYVIIMSHYDHLGKLNGKLYPGADSNASGVVALTTIAEMFQKMESLGKTYRRNVIFVALDGKLRNFAGAKALYRALEGNRLKDPVSGQIIHKDQIELVVNLDQLGSSEAPLTPGRNDYLILLGDEEYARRDVLTSVNRNRRIDMDLAFSYYGSKDFTRLFLNQVNDQRVFLEAGIPSVMFTSGITMRNNKPADDADGLDYPVFRKRIILIFHWLSKWI